MVGKTKIDKLIIQEKKYFLPILKRQEAASTKIKKKWREETLLQRKERLSREVHQIYNHTVQFGHFKGMKISNKVWWGKLDLASMILGTYEQEIVDYIFSKDCKKYSNFINIGAGDGYYSCGLLYSERMQNCLAFEKSPQGRKSIKINSELNHIKNLKIFGSVNSNIYKKVQNLELNRTLILVDIEGDEFSLLDKKFLKFFQNSILIVEIHNWIKNFWSKYENLLHIANNYFLIDFIKLKKKNLYNFKELRDFTDDNRLLLTSESRPCLMRYLILKPKN